MEYPQDFPKHLHGPVDTLITEAEVEFTKAKKRLRSHRYGNEYAVGRLILRFVKKVFFAFAQQAREAVAEGLWTGERMRSAVDEFLHKLVVVAYHQKDARGGSLLELLESDATRRMEGEVKESSEWVEHQEQLAAILRSQTAPDFVRRPIPKNSGEGDGRSKGPAPLHAEGALKGGNGHGSDPVAAERSALLNAYRADCAKRGIRITDEMIAEAARSSWHDRTPVQRWKRNDPRSKPGDDVAIRRLLQKKPHLNN